MTIDDRGVVRTCEACGKKNRLLFARLGDPSRCGECKQPLTRPDAPIEVDTVSHFEALVQHASLPVVVDFWAPWCGPCRMVAPELARVAARQAGQILVVKVNTDALADLGERFGIRSIPTLAILSGGREVGRLSGARPAADIQAFINRAAVGKRA
jgi:thioredoxin 2